MASAPQGTIVVSSVMQDAGFIGTVNRFIGSLSSFGSKLTLVGAALATFGVGIGVLLVKNLVQAGREMREFETQTANLAKVLNSADLGEGIANMIGNLSSTLPVARSELMQVAETAIRLGVRGAGNIQEFVRVMAMVGVATDLAADEAADAFARILKQTRTPISGLEELVSVVNVLGNTMATTDAEIVEAVRRSAPELSRLGLTANEIAVLNASLNEVSESATRAGTRIRRFAQTLGSPEGVAIFAEAMGVTRDEFRKLLEDNPRQLILDIIELFREGGAAAQFLAANLDSRVRQALAALSQNTEGVARGFRNMEEELKAAIPSIVEEFEHFDETVEALDVQLDNLRKEVRRKTLGWINDVSRGLKKLELRMRQAQNAMLTLGNLDAIVPSPKAVDDLEASYDELRKTLLALASARAAQGVGMTTGEFEDMEARIEEWKDLQFIWIMSAKDFAIEAADISEESNAAMNEMIAEADTEGMDRVQSEFGQMTTKLSAFMLRFGQNAEEGGQKFEDWKNSVLLGVRSLVQSGEFAKASALLDLLIPNVAGYAESLGKLTDETETYEKEVDDLIARLSKQVNEMKLGELGAFQLTQAWHAATKEQKELIVGLYAQVDALEAAAAAQKELEQRIENNREKRKRIKEEFAETRKQERIERQQAIMDARALAKSLQEETDALRSLDPEAMKQLERQREINKLHDDMLAKGVPEEIIAEALARKMARFEAEDYVEEMEKLKQQSKTLADLMRENSDAFILTEAEMQFELLQNAIEGVGEAAGNVFDAMSGKVDDLGESIINMIRSVAREMFQREITQMLFKFLMSGGGNLFTVGGGPSGPGVVSPLRPNSAPIGTAPRFNPMTGDPVIPNLTPEDLMMTGGQMSNVTIVHNHYNNIEALDGPSVREILVRERDTVAGITMNTISRSRTIKKSGMN